MNTRTEKDSLGPIEVPIDALYGAQTQRAVENFGYCQRVMPKAFIMALAQIKKAAARANAECECIGREKSQLIISACDEVLAMNLDEGDLKSVFPVPVFQTGSGTSSNMNMNEVIAQMANEKIKTSKLKVHPNDDVNYGQSSNDVIPTSIQLSVYASIRDELFPALKSVEKCLTNLQYEFRSVIKTGRTHLMDAMPLSLGDEFATWCHQIKESRQRLEDSLSRLAQIPLGGTAIGTGINRHRDYSEKVAYYLTEQTGFSIKPSRNLASRISAQDATLEIHGQCKVLSTCLMKIANDIRWMNSGPHSGLAEIQLKPLQPGSSIMPGKVNPVIAESITMMCAEVMGNDTTLTIANQSGNFQLNVMLPLIADKTLESIQLLSDSLTALKDKVLVGFTVNETKLESLLKQNPILATALNAKVGYDKAAIIAKRAQKEGRAVIDVALEETDLSEQELASLLNPKNLARPFDGQSE